MNIQLNPYASSEPCLADEEEIHNLYIYVPELEKKGWMVLSKIGYTVTYYEKTTLAMIYFWTRQESGEWDWSYNSMIPFDLTVCVDDVAAHIIVANSLDIVPMRHDFFCKKYNFSAEDATLLALQLGESRTPKNLQQYKPNQLSENIINSEFSDTLYKTQNTENRDAEHTNK